MNVGPVCLQIWYAAVVPVVVVAIVVGFCFILEVARKIKIHFPR